MPRWLNIALLFIEVFLHAPPGYAAQVKSNAGTASAAMGARESTAQSTYYGFDRNEYPGDASMKLLRKHFAYTSYWLNPPPGATANTWAGKRAQVEALGFGFLVLFNGRLEAELAKSADAAALGQTDAQSATEAAQREGFPAKTVIFLDVEEGGRMLPEQKAYIYAWVDGVATAGFRAGIYCSGIPVKEGRGLSVTTANDLREHAGKREIVYWVANDGCPPSPGCTIAGRRLSPELSGLRFAEVWQYAQSPRRADIAGRCPANYARDGNCYAPISAGPGAAHTSGVFVDLDIANRSDPSQGRTR